MKVTLLNNYIKEFSLTNNLQANTKISIGHDFSYSVKYGENHLCQGEISVNISDKENPDRFKIHLKMVGIFKYEDGVSKEDIHAEAFEHIYPFAKSYIASATALGGIPPVYIPYFDIMSAGIYRIDAINPNKEEN